MSFTTDWFKNNIENWTKWLAEFKGKPNLAFLEIGCFEGRATKWLLDNILTADLCSILVIDTFEGSMENTAEEIRNMEANFRYNLKGYEDKLMVHKGLSGEILRNLWFEAPDYDFIYIDGSHQAQDVLEDSILAWRLLKVGGVLVWDDYGWHRYPDPKMCPAIAIDAFLAIYKGKYRIIGKGYQVCIKKESE